MDALYTIETADGRKLEASEEHPFWVEGKGFIEARRLARSDLLRDERGRSVAVAAVTVRRGAFTVYNFEVAGTHACYAAGWWVHNACPGDIASFVESLRSQGVAGYTQHEINQAISRNGRGVHPAAILDAVRNPTKVTYNATRGGYVLQGSRAKVVLNADRQVITVVPRGHGNTRIPRQ